MMGSMLDGTYRKGERPGTGRIKFGTESNGGFKNITISNCIFAYCGGLALETVDGGLLEDVTITNISMRRHRQLADLPAAGRATARAGRHQTGRAAPHQHQQHRMLEREWAIAVDHQRDPGGKHRRRAHRATCGCTRKAGERASRPPHSRKSGKAAIRSPRCSATCRPTAFTSATQRGSS